MKACVTTEVWRIFLQEILRNLINIKARYLDSSQERRNLLLKFHLEFINLLNLPLIIAEIKNYS